MKIDDDEVEGAVELLCVLTLLCPQVFSWVSWAAAVVVGGSSMTQQFAVAPWTVVRCIYLKQAMSAVVRNMWRPS